MAPRNWSTSIQITSITRPASLRPAVRLTDSFLRQTNQGTEVKNEYVNHNIKLDPIKLRYARCIRNHTLGIRDAVNPSLKSSPDRDLSKYENFSLGSVHTPSCKTCDVSRKWRRHRSASSMEYAHRRAPVTRRLSFVFVREWTYASCLRRDCVATACRALRLTARD